jgi:hypothetical protein
MNIEVDMLNKHSYKATDNLQTQTFSCSPPLWRTERLNALRIKRFPSDENSDVQKYFCTIKAGIISRQPHRNGDSN